MAMSDYLQDKLIQHSLGIASYTMPTTVYVALYTSPTTSAGGGTEVSGGSYARQATAFTAGTAGSGSASNTSTETFTALPTCTVTHAAIRDASSGGNLLFHGPLATSRSFTSGDDFVFAAGDIVAVLT